MNRPIVREQSAISARPCRRWARTMTGVLVAGALAAGCAGSDASVSDTPVSDTPVSETPNQSDASDASDTSDTSPPTAAPSVTAPSVDLVAVTEGLLRLIEAPSDLPSSRGDPVGAGLVLLFALDRGYGIDAIAAAVSTGRLDTSGVVRDADGRSVWPAGADTGVIVDKPQVVYEVRSFRQAVAPLEGISVFDLMEGLEWHTVTVNVGYGRGEPPPPADRPERWRSADDSEVMDLYWLTTIVAAAEQGFSAQEIIEAMIFGQGLVCELVADPFGLNLYSECLLDGRPPGLGTAPSAPASPGPEAPNADEIPPSVTGGSSDDEATFVGTVSLESGGSGLFGDSDDTPADQVFIDTITLVAGDTLDGRLELLANLDIVGDVDCFYVVFDVVGVPQVGDGTGSYMGPITVSFGLTDEACSGPTPPPTSETVEATIDAVITGDTLSASVATDLGVMTFDAQRVP